MPSFLKLNSGDYLLQTDGISKLVLSLLEPLYNFTANAKTFAFVAESKTFNFIANTKAFDIIAGSEVFNFIARTQAFNFMAKIGS